MDKTEVKKSKTEHVRQDSFVSVYEQALIALEKIREQNLRRVKQKHQ